MNYHINLKEQKLVRQCLGNDRVAQRQLFIQYKDAMYTILCRMLNNEAEAADALQETFIKVFQNLSSFRFESTLGAWIKIITIRTAIAKQKKQLHVQTSDIQDLKDNEAVVWPDGLTGQALESAIAQLPPGYRNVFLLVEVEGYAHKEVAEMVGISEGTSKSQLFHSKKMLRKLLDEYRYE